MPLPIAHGLLGATITAALVSPADRSSDWRVLVAGACLAIAPDLDLLSRAVGVRGLHRGLTHSLLVALLLGLVCLVVRGVGRWREAVAATLALGSHGVLDFATSVRGGGVKLLLPITTERFRLGVVSFSEYPGGYTMGGVAWWLCLEVLIFLPPLLVVLWYRHGVALAKDAT